MNRYLATYGKPRFLGIVSLSDEVYDSIKKERLIVVRSHRGEELAEVVGLLDEEQEKQYRALRTISEHGEGPVRGGDPVVTDLDFLRVLSDADFAKHEEQIAAEAETLSVAQELVEWHQLPIKLVDAEVLLDEKKLFFYFTSDQRVDFRTLVKDLARRFKTRIELRQMGVRDEARIIKGLSSCGLPCCCSYWLNQFSPIGIKMVKEQNIALNPAKISGICGRLMCCMAFEHRVYKELWTGLPSPGSKVKTPNGNYIVLSMDVPRKAVRCHKPTGGDVLVPVDLFAEFKQTVMDGREWELPEAYQEAFEAKSKHDCSSCRHKFTAGGLDRQASYAAAKNTGEAHSEKGGRPEKAARDARPDSGRRSEKDGPADDEATKTARKRSGRRRGRRGGRKPGAENQAAAPAMAGEGRSAGQPQRPRKPNASKPKPVHEQPARDAATAPGNAEGEKSKRPRRRRRRPRRPGAGTQAAATE